MSLSERRLEFLTTALLALATVATAWSGYQARQWTGEQAQSYSRATATRLAENREANVANRQAQIDVATFIQWVDSNARHETALARFYRTRFRDEFKAAFAAWIATRPFTNADAPPTPFAMPNYKLKALVESERLESVAAGYSDDAKDANEHANNYMLAVVLFASALFFAGISTRLESPGGRLVILGLGYLFFVGTLIWLGTLPSRFA